MDLIKSAVFIACIMGVISIFLDIAAPECSQKKQLLTIAGIITLLAVCSVFTGKGFKLSLDSYSFDNEDTYYSDQINYNTQNAVLSAAQKKYEEYFLDKLNSNSIRTEKIDVELSLNEQDEVYAEYVYITLYDESDSEQASELVKQDLPDTEILFKTENDNEIQDQ